MIGIFGEGINISFGFFLKTEDAELVINLRNPHLMGQSKIPRSGVRDKWLCLKGLTWSIGKTIGGREFCRNRVRGTSGIYPVRRVGRPPA